MTEAGARGLVRWVTANNPGPLTLDGSRSYLVGGDPCVVVDPGPALDEHVDALDEALGDAAVAAVCLTHAHPDHAGAAEALARRRSAPIAASALTAEAARLGAPGIELTADSTLPFDGGRLEVVPAPGHTPDHVCFHWRGGRALFAGDVIVGVGTSMIAPPQGDMSAYIKTLERLARLELEVIYPGHGPPVTDAPAKLDEYMRHRREREAQVLEALAAGASTVAEIRARVYADLEESLRPAAEGSVRAQLEKLVRDGRVREERDGAYRRVR